MEVEKREPISFNFERVFKENDNEKEMFLYFGEYTTPYFLSS